MTDTRDVPPSAEARAVDVWVKQYQDEGHYVGQTQREKLQTVMVGVARAAKVEALVAVARARCPFCAKPEGYPVSVKHAGHWWHKVREGETYSCDASWVQDMLQALREEG